MRIPGPRNLSVAQQLFGLRSNPISAGNGEARCGKLVWRYEAQPTPLSRTYFLRIAYQQDQRPQIVVESPNLLDLAGMRRLPHVYEQSPTRLCVYQPNRQEWTPLMRIDQTIVPWTALWLFYFEEWLVSDEWKGGGEHPEKVTDEVPRKTAKRRK